MPSVQSAGSVARPPIGETRCSTTFWSAWTGALAAETRSQLAKQLMADAGRLTLAHVYPVRHDPAVRGYNDYEAAQYTHARELLEAAREAGRRPG